MSEQPPADRPPAEPPAARTIAMLGNPNVGKTTLFNRLSGLRQKTSNFPGTTQEAHVGAFASARGSRDRLIDLPGTYSLSSTASEAEVCRSVLEGRLAPMGEAPSKPDVLLLVLDATNLRRSLLLAAEALALAPAPVVVALNGSDLAERRGLQLDEGKLAERLGCPVVKTAARSGAGLDALRDAIERAAPAEAPADTGDRERWADEVFAEAAAGGEQSANDTLTDRLDRAFTHPVLGILTFAAAMTGLFYVIFRLAAYPMEWIDTIFATLGGLAGSLLPPGVLQDLLVNGIIAGVGATVIFLPQIVLLFFLISLLESTGYLARAAFVVDRLLRPFGLSGHAFVPLLSSHACALPGIMAARAVPDPRDRLATILVAPFMSCTARIPVYVLLTGILFPGKPGMQALAFTGCYVLGIAAGLLSSLLARRTILRGKSRPMALELPSYQRPDLRTALITAYDRGLVFLRKAGTVILGISVVLWWLGSYPVAGPSPEGEMLRTQAAELVATDVDRAAELVEQADTLDARHAASQSFLGQLGTLAEPVFAPMGCDRQLTIGVLASFAAREVFASTMAVQVVGADDVEDEGVLAAIATAKRDDGTLIFTMATSWALLVYYVLAMQCLPTLAVTAREAGGAKWAGLQLAWMFGLAYGLGVLVYQVLA